MGKKYVLVILISLIVIVVPGCMKDTPNHTQTVEPSNSITHYELEGDETALKIDIEKNDIVVLSNGTTLKELSEYFNMSIQKLQEIWKFDDGIIDNSYNEYKIYISDKNGLELYARNSFNNNISLINLDISKLSLLGINEKSTFNDITNLLGQVDTVEIEDLFKRTVVYELRYIVNGIRIKFISESINGNIMSNCYIVSDFQKSVISNLEITRDELNSYFNMNVDELITSTNGEHSILQDDSGEFVKFTYFNQEISFDLDEKQNVKSWWGLNGIMLDGINDKSTYSDIEKLWGKPDKKNIVNGSLESEYYYKNIVIEIGNDINNNKKLETINYVYVHKR